MNILEGNYQKNYTENIEKIKRKLNNELNLPNNLNGNNNDSINKISFEYSNILNEKFEEEKNSFNLELEKSMDKNLEIYRKKLKKENEENINSINEEINNLSKNYFMEIDIFKKNYNQRRKKEEESIKNEIQQISSLFETIKANHINSINKEIQEISETIKGNINDYNIESKIEEKISDKLEKEKIKVNELKSYINLIGIEYNNNKQNIEYLTQIISHISKTINEKINIINMESNNNENDLKNKDDLLVNDLINEIQNRLNDFQMNINEKDTKNEIYTLLNNELKNIMYILEKNNNDSNKEVINNMLYSNDKININLIRENNNRNMDLPNLLKSENTFRLNDLNINFTNRGKNIMNNNILGDIENINNNYKSSILNNINRLNESFLNYNYINNNSNNKRFFQLNPKSNFNGANVGISNNIDTTKINSRDNNLENNINEDNDIPKLSDEILNEFSDDLIDIYNKINQFLIEELNRIDEEIMENEKRKQASKSLEEIKNSDELNQYNTYFSQIYSNERNIMNKTKKNIESRLKIYNIIKRNCEDTFNFISNNSYRQNIFRYKLNTLLTHINDYYQMNNFKLDTVDDSNNISNMDINLLRNKSYTINTNKNNMQMHLIDDNDYDNDNNMIKLKNYNRLNEGMDRYNNNFKYE